MANDNQPGVLIYNGKPYAVGLLWFTVQEENAKELLQTRVKKTQADFYCQRLHISQQQAFGWLRKGHRRGMPVAAAMVADQLVGEWHGVFEADNGWWYVQVRSDTITPTGDRFFQTEEEAFNVFQDEMSKHNWPHAYAPDKWRLGDRGIRELPLKTLLDDLVTASLTPANVTAVFGSAATRNLVMGGLLIAFAFMGMLAVYNTFLKPEPVQPVKRISAAQIMAMRKAQQQQIVQIVAPQQLGQKCGEAADSLYVSLPGWQPQKFTCNTANAAMTWKQVTGSLGEAKTEGGRVWPAKAKVSFLNRVLNTSFGMDKLPTVEQEDLLPQETPLLYMEQELKPMGNLQVNSVIPPAPPAPKRSSFLDTEPAPKPPPPPPAYLTIIFKTGFAPEAVTPLLQQPGLELQEMEWAISQSLWQYKIKWYFQRPGVTTPAASPGAKPVVPATNATNANSAGLKPVAPGGSAASQAKQLHPLPTSSGPASSATSGGQ